MPDRPDSSSRNALVVGRMTGVGLDRDAALMMSLLDECSLPSEWRHPRSIPLLQRLPFITPPRSELLIYLERIFPSWRRHAKRSVLIPNQERFPHRHLARLRHADAIFCKTQHAVDIFFKHHPNVKYLGFTSPDRFLPDITPDYSRFLHLAGHSTLKGTAEVLSAWAANPDWPTLTLVIHPHNTPDSVPANVDLVARRVEEQELLELQNSCGIHLCPSRSEGWGHYIVEAMSCRAVTVTTDGPPMNELVTPDRGILVPYSHSEPRHLGTNFHVCPEEFAKAINRILDTPHEDLAQLGKEARSWFEQNQTAFRERFHTLVAEVLS